MSDRNSGGDVMKDIQIIEEKPADRFLPSRDLVRKMLESAHAFDWSWQGFGMFRLYLSKHVRLHVWSPEHATANVTTIHDHPWHFTSKVIAGAITDRLYEVAEGDPTHWEQRIVCGPGGGVAGLPERVRLRLLQEVTLRAGQSYSLTSTALHESVPAPGTITVIKRTFLPDTEHARVFHRIGEPWISAEPRAAKRNEIEEMAALALARLRKDGCE